jgi:hypothetical protein
MTYLEAKRLIKEANRLFKRAKSAWEAGNNSGDSKVMEKKDAAADRFRTRAEELLAPLGIKVDYPGLWPSFKVKGFSYHDTESAVSAAIGELK